MALILISIVCGLIAAAIASSKGRSVPGWFFGGFFFGLIGILIVVCLSNKKDEEARHQQLAQENRRLREKLDQERMKSEVFRQHVAGRLDAHDVQLGVDTRSLQPALAGPESTPRQLTADSLPDSLFDDGALVAPDDASAAHSNSQPPWFFEQNGASQGPVTEPELARMFQSGRLTGATLVWSEPIGEWTAAERVHALRPYIQT